MLPSTIRHGLLLAIALAGCLLALPATAQEAKIAFKLCGFTADLKQMLVAVEDENAAGPVLLVYDLEPLGVNKKVKPIPYTKADQPKAIREARKKLKFTDAGVDDLLYPLDPKDETKSLSFFGLMAAKDRFVLAVTDKQRLGKIKNIEIKRDEETKTLAKASLRQLLWSTDRKLMVAVVTQKIETGTFTSEKDEFHIIKFKLADIAWVEPPADPPPK